MRRPAAAARAVSVGACSAAVPGPTATSEVATAAAGEPGPAAAASANSAAAPVAAGGVSRATIGTGADADPRGSSPGSIAPIDPGRNVGATTAAAKDPGTATTVATQRAQPARTSHTATPTSVTGGRGAPAGHSAANAATRRTGTTIAT